VQEHVVDDLGFGQPAGLRGVGYLLIDERSPDVAGADGAELSERLGVAAYRSLAARGVDVRTNARAICVGARAVALAGGEMLHAATTICTIGTRPSCSVATRPAGCGARPYRLPKPRSVLPAER